MNDRVQVILVITGLSGTPVAAPPEMQELFQVPQPVAQLTDHEPVMIESGPQKHVNFEIPFDNNNYDIPAFLRKRVRL